MDTVDIVATVLGAVLIVVMPFIAVQWKRAKNVIKAISDAIEDDHITADEIRGIITAILGR